MALGAEQMAVVQLLLVQKQSYGDIAGLLGVGEPEVRTRARAALTELGDADPDREVSLTDYLLGQGDAIDRADAIRHLRQSPADREMASRIVAELRRIAPGAELPKLPGESGESRRIAALRERLPKLPTPEASAGARPASGDPGAAPRQRRVFAAIGAGALVLIIVVLALTGVFGGSGDGGEQATASGESGEDSTTASTGSTTPDLSDGQDVQAIPLRASGGSDAKGVATVGVAGEVPYLDVEISNLQAPSADQVYFLWFVQEQGQGYPFVPLEISDENASSFSERFQIPNEYIPVLENASQSEQGAVQVWLSPSRELGKNIQSAVKDRGFVEIPGEEVLSGSLAPPAGQQGGAGNQGEQP